MKNIFVAIFLGSFFGLLAKDVSAQTAFIDFNSSGDTAWFTVENRADISCSVTFRIEYFGKLISSGSSQWRDALRGTWQLNAGASRSEELQKSDAEKWRHTIMSNQCG